MKYQIINSKKRALAVSLFLIILLLIIKSEIQIPCVFHKVTGLYCPGCGITRMLLSMLNFDFYQAFRYNPLCFILFPLIFPYIMYQVYIWIMGKEDKISKLIPNKVFIFIIIILIIFGILRNIDAYSWLGPTIIH